MGNLFGTDGVRGIPGRYPLTADVLRTIAFSAAKILISKNNDGTQRADGDIPLLLLGRDTRGTGPGISRSLAIGFSQAGARVLDAGVIPTPGISHLVSRLGAAGGAVVSASHNPARFNGVKIFDAKGFKLSEASEEIIERDVAGGTRPMERGTPRFWRLAKGERAAELYSEFLRSTFPATLDLSGFKIVVDCANGAASSLAPRLFSELGADVFAISASPNGKNINDGCGALFPSAMQSAVKRLGAQCGISFDGDADRAALADEKGNLLDGDALLCVAALRLSKLGLLRKNTVVVTVMSNYALLRLLESRGIKTIRVPVGDRNVTQAIEREGLSLGGETSGHIVFRRLGPTGDGLVTALETLAAVRESGKPLSALVRAFRAVPQILKNVETDLKIPLDDLPSLGKALRRCEKTLLGRGRAFLRYSGTEPVLRILIEGESRKTIEAMAEELAAIYLKETGQENDKK
ncbi:MAG: phosphoglucosamine mutase [Elusimicrobiota bacterium]